MSVADDIKGFDCDNPDLNDFFHNDAVPYSDQLLGKTHYFTLDKDPSVIICAFTVSNDSLKVIDLPNARRKKVTKNIPGAKSQNHAYFPGVKIGRLGVAKKYHRSGIGIQLMDFIKGWFSDIDNKTGCRFLIIDAYNNQKAIGYYTKNKLWPLFSTEEQEIDYLYETGYFQEKEGKSRHDHLNTRIMLFDLRTLDT